MDRDRDGKIGFTDFRDTVAKQPLLMEAFGECLPYNKGKYSQMNKFKISDNFKKLNMVHVPFFGPLVLFMATIRTEVQPLSINPVFLKLCLPYSKEIRYPYAYL